MRERPDLDRVRETLKEEEKDGEASAPEHPDDDDDSAANARAPT